MSLKEELLNSTADDVIGHAIKGRCAVKEWLKTQDEQLVNEFFELLELDESTMKLYRFLSKKFDTLPFALTTFRLHRNHWCACQ
jgi:hypothetical protein